ncbi:ABC transporter substrate-binding protein [Aestuariimicrobium sp. p3-SID1156]|uniref:ABC transporter substrate-binding protein n=1 Tax=Aestuariimicrobium sp. p3-SID1156 TaxID=2916038 RepID=UPI00223BA743|nr:ABC transporter substrate-binding protein [Aestuariimicrobium sp. p3-SID1156]MCT1459322.1 ABC transporter substrate-binding protein [Aestuariimicrobium sp. p3-SID1156]
MQFSRRTCVSALMGLSLVSVGCSAQPDSQTTGSTGANGGQSGGDNSTINVVESLGQGATLDQIGTPWFNSGALSQAVMFRGLFRAEPNLTDVKDDLAASSELAEDGKTFTVTLKDGLKWSDGKPITGDDVAWSLSTILRAAKANAIYVTAFKQIEGAQEVIGGKTSDLSGVKVDGQKVTIALSNPVGDLKPVLAQFMILPRHALEKSDPLKMDTDAYWRKPITSGPFEVGQLSQGNFITLVPNQNYEGAKPSIQKINVVRSTDPASDAKSGKLDYFATNDPEIIKAMAEVDTFTDNPVDVLFYRYFVFNLSDNSNPMTNVKAREALRYGIDWKSLVGGLYPNVGKIIASGVPEGMEGHDTTIEQYTFDQNRAKELLKEAGVDMNRTLRLRYYYDDQTSINFMTAVAQQLMELGMKVEVLKFQGDATSELYSTRKYDIAFKGLSAFSVGEWYSEYSNNPTFGQIIGAQPEFDALNAKLNQTVDQGERQKILGELQKLEQDKQLKMPLYRLQQHVFVSKRINGTAKFGNPLYIYDNNFAKWKLS